MSSLITTGTLGPFERNMQSVLVGASLRGVAIGIAAVPLTIAAKGVIWCGKKVVSLAENHNRSAWQAVAFKVTGTIIKTIGVIIGVTAALCSATSLGMGFGILGTIHIGPIGGIVGLSIGILIGGIAFLALEHLPDP